VSPDLPLFGLSTPERTRQPGQRARRRFPRGQVNPIHHIYVGLHIRRRSSDGGTAEASVFGHDCRVVLMDEVPELSFRIAWLSVKMQANRFFFAVEGMLVGVRI
jgi:hypothetical protein